jgi:hypothetical protein
MVQLFIDNVRAVAKQRALTNFFDRMREGHTPHVIYGDFSLTYSRMGSDDRSAAEGDENE